MIDMIYVSMSTLKYVPMWQRRGWNSKRIWQVLNLIWDYRQYLILQVQTMTLHCWSKWSSNPKIRKFLEILYLFIWTRKYVTKNFWNDPKARSDFLTTLSEGRIWDRLSISSHDAFVVCLGLYTDRSKCVQTDAQLTKTFQFSFRIKLLPVGCRPESSRCSYTGSSKARRRV